MSETAVNGVEPIIFLDDVHVTFRTRTGSILHPNLVHAVQGVTIKLMPGQTIGIVGESGCGKSTTANVMCGLQAPTSGKVYFKGKDVTKRTAEDRRHMGRVISVVFQNPATALNPRMVVREQLLDPMRVHNLGTEAEQETVSYTHLYARLWYTLPYALIAASLSTALYTELSHDAQEKDYDSVRTGISRGVAQMLFFLIPFALYLIVFARPLNMIYCAGKFDESGVTLVSEYLVLSLIHI